MRCAWSHVRGGGIRLLTMLPMQKPVTETWTWAVRLSTSAGMICAANSVGSMA